MMTEFFMEKRVLERMLQYLETGKKHAKPVKIQILQTLGIFFQNINHSSMVFYLLSNDRINALITHRFDFRDEELMAYYISFIKALSLRVNADTVRRSASDLLDDGMLYSLLTCFTTGTLLLQPRKSPPIPSADRGAQGTQFTCFTSTKVQILTQRLEPVLLARRPYGASSSAHAQVLVYEALSY
jgi:hypothetical protein